MGSMHNNERLLAMIGNAETIAIMAQIGGQSGSRALVRTKWIDGDTTTPAASATGSAEAPYASNSAFMGAAPGIGVIASVSDATQPMIGMVSPATVAVYTENIAVQPYRNIELRGVGGPGGNYPAITGNVTWTNTAAQVTANGGAPANAPATTTFTMHNLNVTGTLTITDDVVTSTVVLSADDAVSNTAVSGAVTCTGASHLSIFQVVNCNLGGAFISVATAAGATLETVAAAVAGNITCKAIIGLNGSSFAGTSFTTAAGSSSSFTNCTFTGASPVMTLGAGSIATFDSLSWASFISVGGTIASGAVRLIAGNPPSRLRYIDGGALATNTPTGDIEAPFTNITNAIANSGASASASDANQLLIYKLEPSTIAAYTENPTFRAFRNYKIIGEGSFGGNGSIGTTVTGNMTWTNTAASGGTAGAAGSVELKDLNLTGSFTITDDGSNVGVLILTGTQSRLGSPVPGVLTNIVATGATNLVRIIVSNASVNGTLTSTANATGAALLADLAAFLGNITAKSLTATRSSFGAVTIAINSGATMSFTQCTFTGAATLVAGAAGSILMDGPSWMSFLENGGAVTSGIVLVVGGFNGAPVEGANLTNVAALSLALNGVGATAGFTGGGNHYNYLAGTALGQTLTITLLVAGALTGDTIMINRGNFSSAQTIVVQDDAATLIATLPVSSRGHVLSRFNGTHFVLAACGAGVTA